MNRDTVAIDTNLHHYFVTVSTQGYAPNINENNKFDPDMNGIALLRCFIYGGYTFYIMPTVQSEYLKTFDEELREKLKRTHDNMFLNRNPCPDHTEVNNLKNYYLGIHNKEKDCQIIAEAEISNINILLTNDKKLYNKVHLKTKSIKIMRAYDFWKRLNIPKGTSPLNEPSQGNFLCGKVWWRW